MSQTLSLKPSLWTDLILKPCVGVMWVISSEAKAFNKVVFPALSNPNSNKRNSFSGVDFNFRKMDRRPFEKMKTNIKH